LKIYYFSTFGMTVIDNITLDNFFSKLIGKIKEAKRIVDGAAKIEDIINGDRRYKDEFLKLAYAFEYIVSRITITGLDIQSKKQQQFLIKILNRKKQLTKKSGAWEQYTNLSSWLIEFGLIMNIQYEEVRKDYIDLVYYSYSRMSNDTYLGYSWEAFQIWKNEWSRIKDDNKKIIKEMLNDNISDFKDRTGVPNLI